MDKITPISSFFLNSVKSIKTPSKLCTRIHGNDPRIESNTFRGVRVRGKGYPRQIARMTPLNAKLEIGANHGK
jgi:hypothetical protein